MPNVCVDCKWLKDIHNNGEFWCTANPKLERPECTRLKACDKFALEEGQQ